MLNSLEKAQFFISGFILLALAGIFVLLGTPDVRTDFQPPEIDATVVGEVPAGGGGDTETTLSEEDRAIAKSILDVAKKHKTVRVRSYKTLTKESLKLKPKALRFLKNRSNWMSELDKAGSEVIFDREGRPTAIEIFDIEEGSFFAEFGLEDGDQLLLVDGGNHDFSRSNISHFMSMAGDGFDRLEEGGTFSVTFVRRGQIVHKEFKVEE